MQLAEVLSTLTLLSSSLASGRPFPGSLPRLADRLIYHQRMSHHQEKQLVRSGTPSTQPDFEVLELEALSQEGNVDMSHTGFGELTIDIMTDEQLPVHSTGVWIYHNNKLSKYTQVHLQAIISLSNICRLIDESSKVIKELCGETAFAGFESLRQEFMKKEEAATFGQHEYADNHV